MFHNETNRSSCATAVLKVAAALLLSICCSANAALMQESAEQSRIEEQIIVTAPKSMKTLRLELGRKTEAFYELWNETLDDETRDFEVICTSEPPNGSRIVRRVCRTRFQLSEMAAQTQSSMHGVTYDPRPALMERQSAMTDSMLEALGENQSLQQAFEDLAALKYEYEIRRDAERRRKADD